ncbi:FMN-binding protein [Vallitalea pronyensis]|uniref:FMN-binding protein n=1 Tax=Vallitalea pronyensis TaxID=1348613 RepID=A0A8J8MJP8_9FIRM|nr:FMN-binding protein [Vallitalea pronyensis]QUI22523.1 FMN-binding protein [Vallitalea pronyensis]
MKKKIIIGIIVVCVVLVGVFLKVKSTTYEPVQASMNLSEVADGTYEGSSETNLVKVTVAVTVKDHKIENIDIKNHTHGLGKKAEAIVDDIMAHQTLQVDGVSGATMSSNVIKLAIEEALK